jgi:hypothetical protein
MHSDQVSDRNDQKRIYKAMKAALSDMVQEGERTTVAETADNNEEVV